MTLDRENQSIDSSFLRSVARTNPPLLSRIVQFNGCIAGSLHLDHCPDELPISLLEKIRSNARGERRLSHYLQRYFALEPAGYWEFARPEQRLALLDSDTLVRLAMFAGVAPYRANIATVIERVQRNNLRDLIGDSAYDFAVRRAAFLIPNPPELPDIAAWNSQQADECLLKAGGTYIANCVAEKRGPLIARLRLKLPSRFPLEVDPAIATDCRKAMWEMLRKILRSEFDREVGACCN